MAYSPNGDYFLQRLDSPAAFWSAEDSSASTKKASAATFLSAPRRTGPEQPLPDDHKFHNDTAVVTATSSGGSSPSLGDFPVYAVAVVALVLFAMTSTFFYFLCRCLARRKKRENQLANLTPRAALDHRMTGVRANQPIQFVVPTTTAVVLSSATEDSISETDYSSSGPKSLPFLADRARRKRFQIDPADLQHGLYLGVAASMETGGGVFLGDLGRVGFSLRYNLQRSQLTVRMLGAKDLPCHQLGTAANPCAKLVLLPDKTAKYVTRTLRNTANPAFDESFSFCVRRSQLAERRLKISIWDYDRFSRKCLVGQVVYNLKDSGLLDASGVANSAEVASGEIWTDLKQESPTPKGLNGEALLSLCYDPDSAILTLTVLKVRGLDMQRKREKESSIYAKVTLYVRRKLVRTKKTPSRRKAPAVELNSPFSIHVPQAALPEVDLMVAVCEKWALGGKLVLGRTQMGTHSLCDQGLQHWQDMLASPKSTCAQWHVLCE